MSFDDVTILVGANGTGKSSVLYALAWFFSGGQLTEEDVSGHQTDEQVEVAVTFDNFDASDRAALGSYVLNEEATFWRTWSADEGEKLTGKARAYLAFSAVREQSAAMARRNAYNELRRAQPQLELPAASSAHAVDAALRSWESDHPDQLSDNRVDATHLFGFTGQARLARRFAFVLVPAVADPDVETSDARGTLLRQLLDRALGDGGGMRERLSELEERVADELTGIMNEEGGATLARVSDDVTRQLSQLVPCKEVLLTASPPTVSVPSLSVAVRVADDGLNTMVARQGHGFQRALMIAVVQQLSALAAADAADEEDGGRGVASASPGLMLALEEPELYQHPLQARHFAATLAALVEPAGAPVQVCYATHSEYFVDPARYEWLRRFQRRRKAPWPQSEVVQATVERVVARLAAAFRPEQIPLRVRMTLRRQLAEAVFANAVLVVEGDSDAGLLHGIADRSGGLDAPGVGVVVGRNKRQLLIPWAILSELGVPSYVVFDGDCGMGDRMLANGKTTVQAEAAQDKNRNENALVLRTLGAEGLREPPTQVHDHCAVFADTLETELLAWPGFHEEVMRFREREGDFRAKPDDAYRHAAATIDGEPPAVFVDLLNRVRGLVG